MDFEPFKGGKFVDSELGLIPKGWSTGTIYSYIDVIYGAPYKSALFNDKKQGLPLIRIRDLKTYTPQYYTKEVLPNTEYVECGDIIAGMDAEFIPHIWRGEKGVLNQRLCKFVPKYDYVSKYYIYSLVYPKLAFVQSYKVGTTVSHLGKADIDRFKVIVPPEDIIMQYSKIVNSYFAEIVKVSNENQILSSLRDTLLPKLMSGELSVEEVSLDSLAKLSFIGYLCVYFNGLRNFINFNNTNAAMKEKLIDEIKTAMRTVITADQMSILCNVLNRTLQNIVIAEKLPDSEARIKANSQLQTLFISAKRVEGCSEKTLKYYASTIEYMLRQIDKNIVDITTTDLRCYLASYQSNNQSSKVTIDNIRRIFSSFFAWLEDEDYILKSPVRRIHKVKTGSLIKEVLSDENLEILRDNCTHIRDLAIVDMLSSTGIRVGELVKINREDIDFHERECIVFGKGNKEREVYFNARTKIHLKQYLESRTDDNPALFVSIAKPHNRLKISGVELRLRQLGRKVSIHKVHPHKFRRTLATMAIDKGMPIEQVQKLLGHVKIDTTMHYAMVNQSNVKISHRKYIN